MTVIRIITIMMLSVFYVCAEGPSKPGDGNVLNYDFRKHFDKQQAEKKHEAVKSESLLDKPIWKKEGLKSFLTKGRLLNHTDPGVYNCISWNSTHFNSKDKFNNSQAIYSIIFTKTIGSVTIKPANITRIIEILKKVSTKVNVSDLLIEQVRNSSRDSFEFYCDEWNIRLGYYNKPMGVMPQQFHVIDNKMYFQPDDPNGIGRNTSPGLDTNGPDLSSTDTTPKPPPNNLA